VVLVDTSVWIETYRRGTRFRLDSAVDFEDVVTCLPVMQEVLQGFRDEAAFRLAREAMHALPMVESPLPISAFDDAVDLYRRARQNGRTVRSSVDCLIAVCALRHNLVVLHHDRDYGALTAISPLQAREILVDR
jgi:predicted nucleic acid-binding protein